MWVITTTVLLVALFGANYKRDVAEAKARFFKELADANEKIAKEHVERSGYRLDEVKYTEPPRTELEEFFKE